ncbi:helix-turn-helix transcriptional regulator [Pedobacter hiemivivus]|uniref:Helix-turn-helix transcriptional regulator n=1 Tax=Pedobacter hiemivivus TaxID=2530454 RepID=A0A4U1GIF3_9SPHI|nr:helix-turn-helix transcriptional regulator [Pedobacter hiemivivus]TKC63634.1 helix-turn-helix transcriptional regulator [Pedobacter hiemivivus]
MSIKKILTELSPEEIVEAYVLPVEMTKAESAAADDELAAARAKRRAQQTFEQKAYERIMLLITRLDDYVHSPDYLPELNFGYVLKEYLELQNKKQNEFAREIDINAGVINQYIHHHRIPNESMFIRFEIHSRNLISAVQLHKLVEKEKQYQISNDIDLRKREAQHVSKTLILAGI